MPRRFATLILFLFSAVNVFGSSAVSRPDNRFKVDVLLVVAHPDDETEVSAYLAKLLDEKRRIAVVYFTRGDAGHNNMGSERAISLGLVREMEVRHALATIGIDNVWFLNCPDTPSQNVLRSLADWHHGAALEQVIRMVRLTRPAVILTWLPAFLVGENHGDHQAAGVLATEAFDSSGNPAIFPAQLAGPVAVNEMLLEGLRPWQPQKIYYFSDAEDKTQFAGTGPSLSVTEISSSRKLPYWRIALSAFSYHLTQYRGYIEKINAANEQEVESDWAQPTQLIFGKSNVGGTPTGDVLAGISPQPVPFVRAVVTPLPPAATVVELAGPWAFYQRFWPEHGLTLLPHATIPQIGITAGETLQIPLTLNNGGSSPQTVTVSVTPPAGWSIQSGAGEYELEGGDSASAVVKLTSSVTAGNALQEIVCHVQSSGKQAGEVKLQVKLRSGGLPQ